jgi:hypothetical protein
MILNGTTYHKETDVLVANALDHARENRLRIRVWYGKDGKSWNEEKDVCGYVGRSTGEVKIPLLVNNSRSLGGPALLDHCIVKIVNTRTKRTLYQHQKFSQDFFGVDDNIVWQGKSGTNETVYATCKDHKSALRLAAFMNGERMSK